MTLMFFLSGFECAHRASLNENLLRAHCIGQITAMDIAERNQTLQKRYRVALSDIALGEKNSQQLRKEKLLR